MESWPFPKRAAWSVVLCVSAFVICCREGLRPPLRGHWVFGRTFCLYAQQTQRISRLGARLAKLAKTCEPDKVASHSSPWVKLICGFHPKNAGATFGKGLYAPCGHCSVRLQGLVGFHAVSLAQSPFAQRAA